MLAKGYVAVPVSFLELGAQLKPHGLTPAEMLFVVCLMAHKWDERSPFPGYKKVAAWMGVSESYVRKLARGLETKHLLKRRPRIGSTNEFDLAPLFEALGAKIEVPETAEESASSAS